MKGFGETAFNQFTEEKLADLPEGDRRAIYQDSNLLNVGSSMGQELVRNNIFMKGATLTLDMKNLVGRGLIL